MDLSELIWEAEFADAMGLSVSALRKWRARGYGPAGFRLGKRVAYRRADVAAFLRSAAEAQ